MNTAAFEGTTGALGLRPEAKEAVKVRYCLYARKSTEQEGSTDEKRELLSHLRGKLMIQDKKIRLER